MPSSTQSAGPAGQSAIVARELSKVYQVYSKPIQQLVDLVLPGKRYREFWALRDVNLDIKRGSTVGIIGENGAGKSTLLKLLSGITYPTHGEVVVHGRVTSLIELGAGFHPEFSGRENIGLSCSIMGLSDEEIRERTADIIAFSELGEFIDRPVKTYSSGMHVRLGFSVATCVDPDILLIDEALSVGDEHFKGKCINRLNEFSQAGGTVVFVSHDMGAVKSMCQHVVLIHAGKVVEQGPPERVADEYLKHVHERGQEELSVEAREESSYPRWGSGEILVEEVELVDAEGRPSKVFDSGSSFGVRMHWRAEKATPLPVFGVGLYRNDGTYINGANHEWQDEPLVIRDVEAGETGTIQMTIGDLPLLQGEYYITVFLYDHSKPAPTPIDHREHVKSFRVVDPRTQQHGLVQLGVRWDLERPGGAPA